MKKIVAFIIWPLKKVYEFTKSALYDLSVHLHSKKKLTRLVGVSKRRRKDMIFYVLVMIIPIVAVFFKTFIINANTLLLAFNKYNIASNTYVWAGLENMKNVIKSFINDPIIFGAFKRSVITYLITLAITTPIPTFISFYIYKKFLGYKFFKIMFFMPLVISPIITVTIFKFITEDLLRQIYHVLLNKEIVGLLSNPNTTFPTVLFYNLWMGLGGGLLVQLGAMNAVDESVIEASTIDGAGLARQFWNVILPATYQVISIGFILGFVTLFSNDVGLYAFYGTNADARLFTLGYYFTIRSMQSSSVEYPFYAAWGLLISAIVIPVTLILRKVIYKYGPSED